MLKTQIYTELNGVFCYFLSQDESKNIQFTVLTDRSQGGGSIQDGNLELMVNKQNYFGNSKWLPLQEIL